MRHQLIKVDQGEAIPASADAYAGLCFMGGPMSVNDELPWIAPILALIRDAVSKDIPVIGHCLGGSGALEAIISVLTIERGVIPPTINLFTPDPECDLDYVPNTARPATVNVAASNSFGFGGTNATIVLEKA